MCEQFSQLCGELAGKLDRYLMVGGNFHQPVYSQVRHYGSSHMLKSMN